jgi:hypothetical protein
MTPTTIKSVIAMKVYDLPNDVSSLLPMMVPLEAKTQGSLSAASWPFNKLTKSGEEPCSIGSSSAREAYFLKM